MVFGRRSLPHLPRHLLFRIMAYRLQADLLGDLDAESQCLLDRSESPEKAGQRAATLARHNKYDDGGFSGGDIDRPAMQRLLDDLRAGKVDVIVFYKVDRLTRSLADFAKLVELFDQHNVSFFLVTQQFSTTTSMGRLTLNVLLAFAQFDREVTSEAHPGQDCGFQAQRPLRETIREKLLE
jgi:hypothetical protein